jgi:site-specific recombinase XerD
VWHVEVPHYEVKNRLYPLSFDLPPEASCHLDFFLKDVRPRFIRDEPSDHLWISADGTAMTAHSIYHCLSRRTLEMFINPHLFRDCAASSLALESPEFARAAAPLLGHSSFATTKRYYVQARQINASRKLNDALLKTGYHHRGYWDPEVDFPGNPRLPACWAGKSGGEGGGLSPPGMAF